MNMLSKLREPVNGLTHLGGAVAAFFGQIALLVVSWDVTTKIVSSLIYGTSLILLFSASAAYHMATARPKVQEMLHRLDHSAIFLLIAGTYTPFCMLAFTGFWRWGLLSIVWAFALIGILLKVFVPGMPRWLHTGPYIVMGWLGVMAAGQLFKALSAWVLVWILIGGVIYTLGAVIYATKKLDLFPGKFGFHELWHVFVLLGALAHFVAVISVLARTG
jgi:hemolysin III